MGTGNDGIVAVGHSTPTPDAIARWTQGVYDIGEVRNCTLLRAFTK